MKGKNIRLAFSDSWQGFERMRFWLGCLAHGARFCCVFSVTEMWKDTLGHLNERLQEKVVATEGLLGVSSAGPKPVLGGRYFDQSITLISCPLMRESIRGFLQTLEKKAERGHYNTLKNWTLKEVKNEQI